MWFIDNYLFLWIRNEMLVACFNEKSFAECSGNSLVMNCEFRQINKVIILVWFK
jgi:hypothetical protein